MNKAAGLILIAAGLAGLGMAGVMVSSGHYDDQRLAPQLSGDTDTLRAAAAGAWRAMPRGAGLSDPTDWGPATVVVTIPTRQTSGEMPQKAVSVAGDRASLSRELQRELSRVGCYEGEITGAWTPTTRQAMKTFMDRVNATLPINQPDDVLLALVQGHQSQVCGTSCPAGQGLAKDGRCLPSAVLASEARKNQAVPTIGSWSTTTTTQPSALGDDQMALAGPKAEINAVATAVEPAQSVRRIPDMGRRVSGDWRAEFWKRQTN